MEKFSAFSDRQSGVNPFVQQPFRPSVGQLLGGGLFALVKLPLLAICWLLLLAASAIPTLIPIPLVARLVRVTFERSVSRALLFLLGFYWIPEVTVKKHAVRVDPSKSNPPSTVRSGDILVMNRCSYVDVLYASATYAPVFTATTQQGGLKVVSLLQALRLALRGSPQRFAPSASETESAAAAEASTARVLEGVLRAGAGGGPIAVFPEGAPTNNNAVLFFTPLADQVAGAVLAITRARAGDAAALSSLRVPTVHVLALSYSPTGGAAAPGSGSGAGGRGGSAFTATFTGPAGSVLAHAWWLTAQASNSLTVMRLPEGYEPQPADFAAPPTAADVARPLASAAGTGLASAAPADTGVVEAPSFSRAVRNALTQMLHGRRAVALGAGHYDGYLQALVESRARAAGADGKKRS